MNEESIVATTLQAAAAAGQALVRVADQPPQVLPAILLDELVPFPGPVVPLLLDREERRDAVLHAKNNTGFLLLINRRQAGRINPSGAATPVGPSSDTADVATWSLDDYVGDGAEREHGGGTSAGRKQKRAAQDDPGLSPSGENSAPLSGSNGEPGDGSIDAVVDVGIDRGKAAGTTGELLRPSAKGKRVANEQSANGEVAGSAPVASSSVNDTAVAGASSFGVISLGDRAAGERLPGSGLRLDELAPIGVVARLIRVFRLPDDRLSALLQLIGRAQLLELKSTNPFPVLRLITPTEVVHDEAEFQATYRQLRLNLQRFFEAHPNVTEEIKLAAMNIEAPGLLADFVAQHLSRDYDERLSFMIELDVGKRLHHALEVAIRELDLLNVGNRISQEIREKVERHQREYLLREQMKAIRTELGEEKDPAALAVAELTTKLEAAKLPQHARARADDELKRLQLLPAESPEHNLVRTYLDWIASLPWSKVSTDHTDILAARKVLDADHYGLEDVKDRILEFLAVRQLNPEKAGSLICFAGPPGVGKTSLGKSIATALGRQFYRFSVGGMRDEAEIKGHRRTYVGAMPGRILQGLRQAGTANPVFMLDELDKMGSDWRGDPSSALLEVLDPAQNTAFADHYLDLGFDLSRVMFIATVNVKTEIPDALRDRLEIIDLPGYIPEEKIQIASRYLWPRQRKEAGLTPQHLAINKPALTRIISDYTHEAGVRELERQIGRVCRKRASQVVAGNTALTRIDHDTIVPFLGPPKVQSDRVKVRPPPGVAVGLAWTPVGGDVLFIEAVAMTGKGTIKVTGQLGEVMSESAALAFSYVRSRANELGIDPSFFSDNDVHLHFPAGAVKKDGPSAGITVTTALISLLTKRSIAPRLAMTGEMTLRGEVLPVGGIREKVVAARRAGVRRVILPARNRADIEEIPPEVRERVDYVFVDSYDEVMSAAFGEVLRASRPAPHAAAKASGTSREVAPLPRQVASGRGRRPRKK